MAELSRGPRLQAVIFLGIVPRRMSKHLRGAEEFVWQLGSCCLLIGGGAASALSRKPHEPAMFCRLAPSPEVWRELPQARQV